MSEFAQQRAEFSTAIERELATRNLNFPTVLDLSLRIKRAADDPDSTLEDIAKLVRIEPVLSARVIQMANSVIFNRAGNSVTNVSTAVRRIGISNVRVTALIVAMDQLGQEHRSRAMRDLARVVWGHSVDVASWAYALARHLRIGNPDTALFAGLMADIGQFYLIARVGSYPAIAADFRGFSELVGFWNAALRRAILEAMALPADILDVLELRQPLRRQLAAAGARRSAVRRRAGSGIRQPPRSGEVTDPAPAGRRRAARARCAAVRRPARRRPAGAPGAAGCRDRLRG